MSRSDRELLDAAAMCEHLLGEGSVHAFLAEHRQAVFPDDMFDDLFPTGRGRPSVPADVIATVMVLQALEALSDRVAVRRLETDITWKAAAGLALTDTAFHSTVLVLWRNKLRASSAPNRIFDAVREVMHASKVLSGKTRRVLDSTVLDDAVARQDTVTMLASQIRRVRRLIPELQGVHVRGHNLVEGRPPCEWDNPADVERLISELVDDALELLIAAEMLVLSDVQADAVGLLALVADQDVEPGDTPGSWRITQGTAVDRVISTVDAETRHAHKTQHNYRDGFKAHIAIEPDTGLVTAADVGPGNVGDATAAAGLIADEPAGTTISGDAGYASGEFREHLEERGMDAEISQPDLRPAVPDGFTLDDFDITAESVTCPNDVTVKITKSGRAAFKRACTHCPFRSRCTTATNGRVIVVNRHHHRLAAARAKARTIEFQDAYRQHRPMVERTLAWLVRDGARRFPYRGIEKNKQWWHLRCAAVNLKRMLTLGLHLDNHGNWAT